MCGMFGILGFKWVYATCRPSQVALAVKHSPANAEDVRDAGLMVGSGRSPARGYGNPLQYSFLENPMNREAWQATVHRVSKSQTWLKRLIMHAACIMPHLVSSKDWYLLSFKHVLGIGLSIGHTVDHLVLATVFWGGHYYQCPHFTNEKKKLRDMPSVTEGRHKVQSSGTVFSWLLTEGSWRLQIH